MFLKVLAGTVLAGAFRVTALNMDVYKFTGGIAYKYKCDRPEQDNACTLQHDLLFPLGRCVKRGTLSVKGLHLCVEFHVYFFPNMLRKRYNGR